MKDYESPIDFIYKTKIDQVEIEFRDTHEMAQGGPVIGPLYINKQKISNYEFGGPYIYNDDRLFTPVYVKDGRWGFKLAEVNIYHLNISLLGGIKSLIYLEKIENNRIYFFEDICKQKSNYYELK